MLISKGSKFDFMYSQEHYELKCCVTKMHHATIIGTATTSTSSNSNSIVYATINKLNRRQKTATIRYSLLALLLLPFSARSLKLLRQGEAWNASFLMWPEMTVVVLVKLFTQLSLGLFKMKALLFILYFSFSTFLCVCIWVFVLLLLL